MVKLKPIKWQFNNVWHFGSTPIWDFVIKDNLSLHVGYDHIPLSEWETIGRGDSIEHCKEVAQRYYEFRLRECVDEAIC